MKHVFFAHDLEVMPLSVVDIPVKRHTTYQDAVLEVRDWTHAKARTLGSVPCRALVSEENDRFTLALESTVTVQIEQASEITMLILLYENQRIGIRALTRTPIGPVDVGDSIELAVE